MHRKNAEGILKRGTADKTHKLSNIYNIEILLAALVRFTFCSETHGEELFSSEDSSLSLNTTKSLFL